MKVYKLKSDLDNYQWLIPTEQSQWRAFWQISEGRSVSRDWSPIQLQVTPDSIDLPMGDSPHLMSGVPLLTNHGMEHLHRFMEKDVEFLQVFLDQTPLWAVNVVSIVDTLDLASSDVVYWQGDLKKIKCYSFRSDKLEGRSIFRIPQTVVSEVFVSEEVKLAIAKAGLKGLICELVWKG